MEKRIFKENDSFVFKTLLVALLKKEVVSVEMHRQPVEKQYINLDENKYEGDEVMMRIIHHLTAATVTASIMLRACN